MYYVCRFRDSHARPHNVHTHVCFRGLLCGDEEEELKVECSLILLSAEGDGKFVSLLMLTELSLPTDRAELNPLELEVLLPKPYR